jgi:hypothetical protein
MAGLLILGIHRSNEETSGYQISVKYQSKLGIRYSLIPYQVSTKIMNIILLEPDIYKGKSGKFTRTSLIWL